jgi:glutaconate CoA-transferase subunit B
MDFTLEDVMVVCMARQVRDGEIVAQGLATPLVAAAYLLARCTHAPNLYFTSAIGQGLCRQPAPLGLTRVESLWLDRSLITVGFVRAAADMLPRLRPKEFFRPAQIDPQGNFNNIAFGQDYRHPRLRLPGTGGIPDVTTFIHDICLYVPRHSRVTFVARLDFLSGMGHHPARRLGSGPRFLISNLGQFDFGPEPQTEGNLSGSSALPAGEASPKRHLRLVSYHPGVGIDRIQAKTGFELDIAPEVHETAPPSEEELRLLYEEIDPLGIRRLESLSGAERRKLLHEIVALEAQDNRSTFEPALPYGGEHRSGGEDYSGEGGR